MKVKVKGEGYVACPALYVLDLLNDRSKPTVIMSEESTVGLTSKIPIMPLVNPLVTK